MEECIRSVLLANKRRFAGRAEERFDAHEKQKAGVVGLDEYRGFIMKSGR